MSFTLIVGKKVPAVCLEWGWKPSGERYSRMYESGTYLVKLESDVYGFVTPVGFGYTRDPHPILPRRKIKDGDVITITDVDYIRAMLKSKL